MARKLKEMIADEKPEVVARAARKSKSLIAKEAAPKRPTIKSLQEQVDTLTKDLEKVSNELGTTYAVISKYEQHCKDLDGYIVRLQSELLESLSEIGELKTRSVWQLIKSKFSKE